MFDCQYVVIAAVIWSLKTLSAWPNIDMRSKHLEYHVAAACKLEACRHASDIAQIEMASATIVCTVECGVSLKILGDVLAARNC